MENKWQTARRTIERSEKERTKAKLRGAQRREIVLQRNMNMDEIMNAQCRDIKTFYKLVNSYRKRPSVQIEELIVGDETYTTPENILEGWKNHFETLATPAKNYTKNYTNTEFDLDLIYEIYTEMNNELNFSEKELEKAIRSLNSKKAPDVYGLTAEHLKYGGSTLVNYLTELLNNTCKADSTPDLIKLGILSPVFKRKG